MRNIMLPTICGKVQLKRLEGSPQGGLYQLTVWRRNLPTYKMFPIGEPVVYQSYKAGRTAAYAEYISLLAETKEHARTQL